MADLVDTIGALVFGFLLMMIAGNFNLYVNKAQQQSTFDGIAQQNCVQLGEILENDLYMAGYNVNNGTTPFLYAGSDSVSFISDIDANGTLDTVSFSKATKATTTNPHQKYLVRWVKSGTLRSLKMNVGLTNLTFSYYDSTGQITAVLKKIAAVKVSLDVESSSRSYLSGGNSTPGDIYHGTSASSDSVYNGVHWQQFIVPKRLHV